MLSRGTYLERGAITAALAIAPWVALLTAAGDDVPAPLPALLLRLGIVVAVFAVLGAGVAFWLHRVLGRRGIQWGGYDETAALLKQAGAELVTGKPDEKLFSAANRQADNQDGRATGIYLFTRMAQLRHTDSFMRKARPNPIPLLKRLTWTLILAAIAMLIAAWPATLIQQLPLTTRALLVVVATPLFVTAVLIAGIGLRSADAWLYRLAGMRMPQRSTVKLRRREVRSAAGQWHKQGRGPDIPLFRVMLGVIALIAALLYVLREYEDEIFGSEPILVEAEDTAELPPERPEPVVTPTPRPRVTPRPKPRRTAVPAPRSEVSVQTIWAQLRGNGTAVHADRSALKFAGWDLDALTRDFAAYKRARLDDWYIRHLREHPHDLGKISFRVTLQPQGSLTNIRVLASQINDSTFTNGLIDRLDAVQLQGGGLDAVTITLSFDFRL